MRIMKLSVVIPAFNEEKRIGLTLQQISTYLGKQHYLWEILVVNDGSTDKTKEVVLEMKSPQIHIIDNPCNKGKGYSIREGFLAAKGDLILFSDADLSTPIEELETLLSYAEEFPIIIGSRNLDMSKIVIKQPWLRSTLGKIFPVLVRLLLVQNIKDTQCGFKLFNATVAKKIAKMQQLNGFAFDAEQLFIAQHLKYRIKEIPVSWANDERSKVHIFTDSFFMLFDLLHVRLFRIMGKYDSLDNKLNKE